MRCWVEMEPTESLNFVFIKLEPIEESPDHEPKYEEDPCAIKSEEPSLVETCPFEVICKIEEYSNDGPASVKANKTDNPVVTSSSKQTDKLSADNLSEIDRTEDSTYRVNSEHAKTEELNLVNMNTSDEKPFSCDQCSKNFSQNDCLNKHKKRKHSGIKPHECKECNKRFVTNTELQSHSRTHTGERPYPCPECGQAFAHRERMKAHYRTHSGVRSLDESYPFEVVCKIEEYSNDGPVSAKADKTDKPVVTSSSNLTDKLSAGNLPKIDPTKDSARRVNSKQTKTKDFNRLNINTTDEKPFSCDQCPKKFSRHNYLNRHIKREHSGIKPHECEECNKRFVSKAEVRSHSRTHTGERPFSCPECGRAFAHREHLKAHIRSHTGERPYKCDECDKAYTDKKTLRLHKIKHTGEKPFRCTICEKAFSWPHILRNHLKIHAAAAPAGGEKSFSCEECGRSFARKCTLQYHLVTHAGQMPFVCEQCGRGFARSSSLNLHVKTHVEVKPFACAECGKRFPLIGRLKKHEQVHLRSKDDTSDSILGLVNLPS